MNLAPDTRWWLADSEIKDRKHETLLDIVQMTYPRQFNNALIVGCGSGREAFSISQHFHCNVTGIDIDGAAFLQFNATTVRLLEMDASRMDFGDRSFDLLYSFHVIEHLSDLDATLNEMLRVLQPSGVFCIGTPNKSRLLGYVGVDTSLTQKLLGNVKDWQMRLSRRWENSLGAHAGFKRGELQEICERVFGEGKDVTEEYYRKLYKSWAVTIDVICKARLSDAIFPSVYVVGERTKLR